MARRRRAYRGITGTVSRLFDNSKHVNVDFPSPVGPITIGIDFTELVPAGEKKEVIDMAAQFPAYQNMISCNEPEAVLIAHKRNLCLRDATNEDCWIVGLEAIPDYSLEYEQGFRSRYQLHWKNYVGWKVYMLHTGCFAFDPKYEVV